jgi:TrmH family RNA methyltransferase
MRTLSSAKNPLLKDVRKAVARGSLTESGLCVAEGWHLLDEAVRSRMRIGEVLVAEAARSAAESRGLDCTFLPDALFREVMSTEMSQGVISLVQPPHWEFQQLLGPAPALVMILDAIQDPGNAGTILRAAEAFGCTGVCFAKGSVNPYNPKALRASAGSVFRVPLVTGYTPGEILAELGAITIYAATAGADRMVQDVPLGEPCAIVLGNEGSGVGPEFRAAATPVSIPTRSVESLNVAMAASILVYEARRQRT